MDFFMDCGASENVVHYIVSSLKSLPPITAELVYGWKKRPAQSGIMHADFGTRSASGWGLRNFAFKIEFAIMSAVGWLWVSIKVQKGKYILSDRKSENRLFVTVRKRDSNKWYTATIIMFNRLRKANFPGCVVLGQKMSCILHSPQINSVERESFILTSRQSWRWWKCRSLEWT